jgi:hypothetical protein
MSKKKVLICDDQQRFLDSFCERHKDSYDITPVLDSKDLMGTIEEPGGLPDIVLLDLYFPYDNTPESHIKIEAAEKELKKLDEQISATKRAVLEAWEPRGIELLKMVRDKYPATVLPVVIFTQKGLLLLDDEQIRKVEENNGHWLLKGQLSARTEEVRINRIMSYNAPISKPGKVFIGHGRNPLWRELKDYLNERLKLEWNEFNRESVAGIPTFERLSNMLDTSLFAFLIMTKEDEHADSTLHARENVVHEIGLFQGRLGPRKSIILLEEGCHEFSNIAGLTQIRFPQLNISAVFEEIRKVLEREGILKK